METREGGLRLDCIYGVKRGGAGWADLAVGTILFKVCLLICNVTLGNTSISCYIVECGCIIMMMKSEIVWSLKCNRRNG